MFESNTLKSALVSLITGYANPVQSSTSEIDVSCGGYILSIKEAVIMVPILTQSTPTFKFCFLALPCADMRARPCRVYFQAVNEKEARRVLTLHFILSLAARLSVQEMPHA